MPKTGVLSVSPNLLRGAIPLKKFYLLFDKLYLEQSGFVSSMKMLLAEDEDVRQLFLNTRKGAYDDLLEKIKHNKGQSLASAENLDGIGFLMRVGCLSLEALSFNSPRSDNEEDLGDRFFSYISHEDGHTLEELTDETARILSIIKNENGEDTYPLLINPSTEKHEGRKTAVVNFLLGQIPEPIAATSWEQLLDFKSDPDTMRKYYALIKWINEISKKDFSLSEVEDEYKYLYHEYVNQYKLHKMKYKMSVLETFVNAGIDLLSGQLGVGPIKTSLFSIWRSNLNLLEAESKFSGREVAYIYKAGSTIGMSDM